MISKSSLVVLTYFFYFTTAYCQANIQSSFEIRKFNDTHTNGFLLTADSGGMYNLNVGVCYIMTPDPFNPPTTGSIVPITEDEYGIAAEFIFQMEPITPQTELEVSFELPLHVAKDSNIIEYSYMNACWVMSNSIHYLDPTSNKKITIDSTGKVTFYLGMAICIPGYADGIYTGDIVCTVKVGDSAKQATAPFIIQVHGVKPGVFVNSGYLNNLSNGIIYTLEPKNRTVTPHYNGFEVGSPLEIEIYGDPFAILEYSFSLPSQLLHDTYGSIASTFSNQSLYFPSVDTFFNPLNDGIFILNDEGMATMHLGISINVSRHALPGYYLGAILCTFCHVQMQSSTFKNLFGCGQILGEYSVYVGTPNYIDGPKLIPIDFRLHQNYPNPFNPSTTIRYELPKESFITLKVYNLLGQEVATLVNGKKEAGWHYASFDGSGLSAGVYPYRLSTDSFMETKALVLLK